MEQGKLIARNDLYLADGSRSHPDKSNDRLGPQSLRRHDFQLRLLSVTQLTSRRGLEDTPRGP